MTCSVIACLGDRGACQLAVCGADLAAFRRFQQVGGFVAIKRAGCAPEAAQGRGPSERSDQWLRDAALERVAWLEGLERLRIERRAEMERTRRRWVTP